jgi:hypothetical protein
VCWTNFAVSVPRCAARLIAMNSLNSPTSPISRKKKTPASAARKKSWAMGHSAHANAQDMQVAADNKLAVMEDEDKLREANADVLKSQLAQCALQVHCLELCFHCCPLAAHVRSVILRSLSLGIIHRGPPCRYEKLLNHHLTRAFSSKTKSFDSGTRSSPSRAY